MRFPWSKKLTLSVGNVDDVALAARAEKTVRLLRDAAFRTADREPKKAKAIAEQFYQIAEMVEAMNGEQLAALLDCIEASTPEKFLNGLKEA